MLTNNEKENFFEHSFVNQNQLSEQLSVEWCNQIDDISLID